MAKKLNQEILIELIDLSAGTQQRPLSPDVVTHYQNLRKDGVELPPIELIWDGKLYYVWDGFHRLAVAQKMSETKIRANVEVGNMRRAVFLSFTANSTHGLPRQAGMAGPIIDKMLADPEWGKMPLATIAKHVGCSRQYVFERKSKISCQVPDEKPESTQNPPPKKPETEPTSPLHDDEGQVVPSHLADRFLSRVVIRERITEIDKWKNSVMNKIGEGDMTYALLNQTGFLADFKNLRARLKAARPYALCPYCKAKGCGACHNSGFLNEESWKVAPKNE
jgi:hypothetical protein